MMTWVEYVRGLGMPEQVTEATVIVLGLLILATLSVLANLVAKRVILRIVHLIVARSRLSWFRILEDEKVFRRLSHVAPAIVIQRLAPVFFAEWGVLQEIARIGVNVYLICVALLVVDGLLNSVLSGYEKAGPRSRVPIKGFIQAIKLVAYMIGLILIVSTFLGKEPFYLLSGLGALTAVLMLVFKDAILGFVAGIQLSANDMVKKGDWIEMPKQGADGNVVDVSLTTVKVQNFDRTITTVPSYLLISDSFKNWRGMVEAGGRRMMRSIHIDARTVRFLDAELLERCKKIQLLRPYLEQAVADIQKHNQDRKLEMDDLLNGRQLTNIGTFRAYCVAYLQNHPRIHRDFTQLVRQLEPTEHGIPLQIYGFVNDTAWANYEGVQADIFDHLFAVIPHFGLRLFQEPSGWDVQELAGSLRSPA